MHQSKKKNPLQTTNNQTKAHIHILGIAGIGMSGIAKLFHSLGYRVTGSDLVKNSSTDELEKMGIHCYQGHRKANLISEMNEGENFALICTSAIDIRSADRFVNAEVQYVIDNQLNLYTRAEALAELAKELTTIAISGTHGKTTTTSLINFIFEKAGLEPSFLIGGMQRNIGKNAQLGKSKWFVLEADESDGTFLYLRPHIAVITNIDEDHLEFYHNDFEKLKQSFVQFVRNLGINDYAVICAEDKNTKSLIPQMHRTLITYGFDKKFDIYASEITQRAEKTVFLVRSEKLAINDYFEIKLPGYHNILNSLAAITSAKLCGIDINKIKDALFLFEGVKRRFESLGYFDQKKRIEVIDDYAHHPEEITYTLNAAKVRFQEKRIVALFQAHRYSRTFALLSRFSQSLSICDELILMPIFSAGEENIHKIHNHHLMQNIRKINPNQKLSEILDDEFNSLNFVEKAVFLRNKLEKILSKNDVLITMGAGSIRSIVDEMLNLNENPIDKKN